MMATHTVALPVIAIKGFAATPTALRAADIFFQMQVRNAYLQRHTLTSPAAAVQALALCCTGRIRAAHARASSQKSRIACAYPCSRLEGLHAPPAPPLQVAPRLLLCEPAQTRWGGGSPGTLAMHCPRRNMYGTCCNAWVSQLCGCDSDASTLPIARILRSLAHIRCQIDATLRPQQ